MLPYSYCRYLSAKKTVDDRALNQHVISSLRGELARSEGSIRVVEVGAGLGTMVARLLDWRLLERADYVLLDVDRQSLRDARSWLADWAATTNRTVTQAETESAFRIQGGEPNADVTVRPFCAELRNYLESSPSSPKADLLIANAFLDLVELPETLRRMFNLLVPGGIFWFSINFDGESIFLPEHTHDRALLDVYHRSMDERVRYGRPAGDSRTGRHLFGHLRQVGANVAAVGSSDWVVHAVDGHYRSDEAYFLEHILHTIEEELNWRGDVDQPGLQDWLTTRRSQVAHSELVYIAHQLDFVGRTPRSADLAEEEFRQ